MQNGLVFNIQRFSVHDGPGIRTTVFLKGCPLSCWWCHNPEGIGTEPELVYREARCVRCGRCREVCLAGATDCTPPAACTRCGACAAVCPTQARELIGRRMTVDQIMAEILRDEVFYEGEGGATFSGGEPLLQADFLCELLAGCRRLSVHCALDTSGYAPTEQLLRAAGLADLVLYDLKALDDSLHQELTGVSNRQILANLAILAENHRNVWLRIPLIPGVNDSAGQMSEIGRLASAMRGVRQIHLLPYHRLGVHKPVRRVRPVEDVFPPLEARMAASADQLRSFGLTVLIGG